MNNYTFAERVELESREEYAAHDKIVFVLQHTEDLSIIEKTLPMSDYSKITNAINQYLRLKNNKHKLIAIRSFNVKSV